MKKKVFRERYKVNITKAIELKPEDIVEPILEEKKPVKKGRKNAKSSK